MKPQKFKRYEARAEVARAVFFKKDLNHCVCLIFKVKRAFNSISSIQTEREACVYIIAMHFNNPQYNDIKYSLWNRDITVPTVNGIFSKSSIFFFCFGEFLKSKKVFCEKKKKPSHTMNDVLPLLRQNASVGKEVPENGDRYVRHSRSSPTLVHSQELA